MGKTGGAPTVEQAESAAYKVTFVSELVHFYPLTGIVFTALHFFPRCDNFTFKAATSPVHSSYILRSVKSYKKVTIPLYVLFLYSFNSRDEF
jgi:hypothetical protein